MTTYDATGLPDRLRAWARGSRPHQAAVDFLLETGTELTGHLVRDDGDRAWLDVFEVDPEEWERRVGWMSGGQRATWELVRSILEGELDAWFWRLDTHRKSALVAALGAGLAEQAATEALIRAAFLEA